MNCYGHHIFTQVDIKNNEMKYKQAIPIPLTLPTQQQTPPPPNPLSTISLITIHSIHLQKTQVTTWLQLCRKRYNQNYNTTSMNHVTLYFSHTGYNIYKIL